MFVLFVFHALIFDVLFVDRCASYFIPIARSLADAARYVIQ